MAAINAVMTLLQAGDHVIVSDNTYGGTFRLFDKVLKKFGLEFSYVDTREAQNVDDAVRAFELASDRSQAMKVQLAFN